MNTKLDSDAIKAHNPILTVVQNEGVKLTQKGKEWVGKCPFHEDKTASFSVNGDKGVYQCFGCHASGDVIGFVKELRGLDFKDALEYLNNSIATPAPTPQSKPQSKPKKLWQKLPNAEAYHYYYNKDGKETGVVVRRISENWAKKRKVIQFAKVRLDDGKWVGSDKELAIDAVSGGGGTEGYIAAGIAHPAQPYLAHTLKSTRGTVLVVEGENTADSVAKTGQLVISWLGGTGAVKKTDWSVLKDRQVLVCADDDEPGRKAARQIATASLAAGASKVVLKLPAGNTKKDIADYPDAMESIATIRQWVLALPAEEPTPPPASDPKKPKPEPDATFNWRNNEHWQVLGYDNKNNIIIYVTATKQHYTVSKAGLFHYSKLYALKEGEAFWERLTGGIIRKREFADCAANQLLFAATRAGAFNPQNAIRKGAFNHKGAVWTHCGDCVVDDKLKVYELNEVSDAMFMPSDPMPKPLKDPAGITPWRELAKLLKEYRWLTPGDGQAYMGWLVVSILSGALDWRPHLWMLAPPKMGKTWLLNNVCTPLLDVFKTGCQHLSGNSTEAGLRRVLERANLPVVVDEAMQMESGQNPNFSKKMDLVRLSSNSGAALVQAGSASTNEIQIFKSSSGMLFTGNIKPIMQEQDSSRITLIQLSTKDVDGWPVRGRAIQTLMSENAPLMVRTVLGLGGEIKALIATAHEYLADGGAGTREAEQMSTLAAGYAWATSEEVEPIAKNLLSLIVTSSTNEAGLLERLLSVRLRPSGDGIMGEYSVGDMIRRSAEFHNAISTSYADINGHFVARLNEFGIKVKKPDSTGDIVIQMHTSSGEIKKELKGSEYQGVDIRRMLEALPNATVPKGANNKRKKARFGGAPQTYVEINLGIMSDVEYQIKIVPDPKKDYLADQDPSGF